MVKVPVYAFIFAFIAFVAYPVELGVVKYDQTQTGDYNVHLDLKNIDIVALFDDSSFGLSEYDDYDYGHLTLKPPSIPPDYSTTLKPTNATTDLIPENNSTTSSTETSSTQKPNKRCGAGFYRDGNGRCRRLRKPIKLGGLLQQTNNRLSG